MMKTALTQAKKECKKQSAAKSVQNIIEKKQQETEDN